MPVTPCRLFPPLAAQLLGTAGEFVIGNRTHRLPPSLGTRLEAEDFMFQVVELALDTGQTFFNAGGFHVRKIGLIGRFAKDGCRWIKFILLRFPNLQARNGFPQGSWRSPASASPWPCGQECPLSLSFQQNVFAQHHQVHTAFERLIDERSILRFRFHELLGEGRFGFGIEQDEVGGLADFDGNGGQSHKAS